MWMYFTSNLYCQCVCHSSDCGRLFLVISLKNVKNPLIKSELRASSVTVSDVTAIPDIHTSDLTAVQLFYIQRTFLQLTDGNHRLQTSRSDFKFGFWAGA